MKMKKMPPMINVTVNALVIGDKILLIDRHGRRIGTRRKKSDVIGFVDADAVLKLQWKYAAHWAAMIFWNRNKRRNEDDWTRKTNSMAASCRVRGYFSQPEPTGKTRLSSYPTTRWDLASSRLWQQIHNRIKKHNRSGWQRWAETTANNHNKKKGNRYEKAGRNHRVSDHETDRKSEVQVCFDWSRPDPRNCIDRPHHASLKKRVTRP